MLKASLRDFSDACILVKGTMTVASTAVVDANAYNTNIKVIFKNCAPFSKFKTEINNTKADNTAENTVTSPNFLEWKFCGNVSKCFDAIRINSITISNR